MEKPEKKWERGPKRTTRDDWLQAAIGIMTDDGVERVKVLTLAEKIGCARSSFYHYFQNQEDLFQGLLETWERTNTAALLAAAQQPAPTVNAALAHLIGAWVGAGQFDKRLDFAIRDWARRSEEVLDAVTRSDATRIKAIAALFLRYGYREEEADTRARIVYFTQIGYDALDQRESWEDRLKRSHDYLFAMTGKRPNEAEVRILVDQVGAYLLDAPS